LAGVQVKPFFRFLVAFKREHARLLKQMGGVGAMLPTNTWAMVATASSSGSRKTSRTCGGTGAGRQRRGCCCVPTTRRSTVAPPYASVYKKYLRMTIHRHEVASLLPRGLRDVFYKTATAHGRSGDGVIGEPDPGSKGDGGALAGEAGDTMDACRLNGFGQGHRRQDGGEPACQHQRARPRGAQQEEVMGRTPASRLPAHPSA
jgi:hypothetical protein